MNSAALQQPRTEQGNITVANIYPSKGPGKSAYIKDVDGMMFGIWPDKLNQIQVGGIYEIEFSSNTKNGTTYRDIKQVHMVEKPQPAARSLSSAAAAPSQRIEQPQNGGYFRPTAPKDARRMFLCSTLNAFIQTGRIDLSREHMKQAIAEILAAYDATVALEDGS